MLPDFLAPQKIELFSTKSLAVYAASHTTRIVISNEVGLGFVPPYPLGRIYRDALGKVNHRMEREAEAVFLIATDLSVALKEGGEGEGAQERGSRAAEARPAIYCRRARLPTATRNMTLLPLAWGEKKYVTASSLKVSPLASSRWA